MSVAQTGRITCNAKV